MDVLENLILPKPYPNFVEFLKVLNGEQPPHRVHLIELLIDEVVIKHVSEKYFGENYKIPGDTLFRSTSPSKEQLRQIIQVYYHLGYDCVPLWSVWKNHPSPQINLTPDTAELTSGMRIWMEEHAGLINSWEDYYRFPWSEISPDLSQFTKIDRLLPTGMKVVIFRSLFDHVMTVLLGYEGFFLNLHDRPDLVEAVFEKWGQKVYEYYSKAIGFDSVGAIFHCDDIGHKTSTLISPKWLRKLFFPWLKEFVTLAHKHNKPFWLHSCGNLYAQNIIEELITDIGIDGFHSFQDVILPVSEFKRRYGDQVSTLGGVDMDKLVRMKEKELRKYLRKILESCMLYGRYAFGSANSIANYVPLKNYAILLDEARRWNPPIGI